MSEAGPLPPSGVPPSPRANDDASDSPFQSPTKPGLSVSAYGRSCDSTRFDILEVAYAPDRSVAGFAADLEQHCEGGPPALWGSVRYNASEAYPVRGGPRTGTFQPLTPSRILDTRSGDGAPVGKLGPARALGLQVTGRAGCQARACRRW